MDPSSLDMILKIESQEQVLPKSEYPPYFARGNSCTRWATGSVGKALLISEPLLVVYDL